MWGTILPIALGFLGSLFGGGGGSSGGQTQMSEEQRRMLEESLRNQNARVNVQNPLYEMATQLAMSLMPRSATPSRFYLPGPEQIAQPMTGGGIGRIPPAGGTSSLPPGATNTSAAVQALARGLTNTGSQGISVANPAQLFAMPPRGPRQG